MDLNPNLGSMDLAQLVEHQQALTRHRKEVLAAAAATQAELDRRRRELDDRRAAEDRILGQQGKPPPQSLFGEADAPAAHTPVPMLADQLPDGTPLETADTVMPTDGGAEAGS